MIELPKPNSTDIVHNGLYLKITKDGKKIWIPLEGNPALDVIK